MIGNIQRNSIPEYKIWKAMRARCYAPCNKETHYQINNITICDRWNNFELFYLDMGTRPSKKHSIDRIDNLGNYEPDNCRWTTQDVQCSNRSGFNVLIEHNGETKVLKQWAKDLNLSYSALHKHLAYKGHTFAQALAIMQDDRKLEFKGQRKTRKELASEHGITVAMLNDRLSRKWTLERALTQKPKIK